MSSFVPSATARPRFVNHAGNILDPELVNSIRKQAELPNDAQIHDLLSHQEHDMLTMSAMARLYKAETDVSLPWLPLILDHIARSTYEVARQPRPESEVKYRAEKTTARNDKGRLLRDIRRLRTNVHLNCSMEDGTHRVSPLDASSTAGKVDLELIRLELELDARGKAMSVTSGDVWVDLPPSLGLLCKSILTEYRRVSGKKSTLIEKARLFHFDIGTVLGGKIARYSTLRQLHRGLQKLSMILKTDDEYFEDIRNAVKSNEGYEQLILNAIYDLRMFVDRQPARRSNKELTDVLVGMLNDIACVQDRLSDATELPESDNDLKELLQTLFSDVVDLIGRINRLPMRTGREPNSIRLRQLITELRYWHVKLTGESRSFTVVAPDNDMNIPEFTTGPFFNFVKVVSGYLNLVFDDNTLRKVISQARHDLEISHSNPIMDKENKFL